MPITMLYFTPFVMSVILCSILPCLLPLCTSYAWGRGFPAVLWFRENLQIRIRCPLRNYANFENFHVKSALGHFLPCRDITIICCLFEQKRSWHDLSEHIGCCLEIVRKCYVLKAGFTSHTPVLKEAVFTELLAAGEALLAESKRVLCRH